MVGPNPDHVTDSNSIAFTMFPVSSMFALFKDSFEIQYISKILPSISSIKFSFRFVMYLYILYLFCFVLFCFISLDVVFLF